jgi:hypothetical protein
VLVLPVTKNGEFLLIKLLPLPPPEEEEEPKFPRFPPGFPLRRKALGLKFSSFVPAKLKT